MGHIQSITLPLLIFLVDIVNQSPSFLWHDPYFLPTSLLATPLAEPQGTALKTIYLPKTFKFIVPTHDF